MAAASGYARVIVGQGGLLSTPAASILVRRLGAHGAVILSASHNPGGPDGDFGVKYNTASGGPASPALTDRIYTTSLKQNRYKMASQGADLDRIGAQQVGDCKVEVISSVVDYANAMEELFDFKALRGLFARPGFRFRFDAMHAVTGPYAKEIFERRLGAPAGTVIRGEPLPDFGGEHPDPHPTHLSQIMEERAGSNPPDFAAACDGDGDRNIIMGPDLIVSPGDSLAVLAANLSRVPHYAKLGLSGVARSLPTSRAVDRVAQALGVPCYETPTGWKFFTNLLDAGRITLCGEESFGTGSGHCREKDGLWAVLFWLSLLADTKLSVREILEAHWAKFGRDHFRRLDYEDLDTAQAGQFFSSLRSALDGLPGRQSGDYEILAAEDFAYTDPVDGSHVKAQGLRISLSDDAEITYRLSGTGARGATLRVYLEHHVPPHDADILKPKSPPLEALATAASRIAAISERLGRTEPSSIS